ncbi:basic 7s globulin 2 [Phtheirospermum japonicum]|uniref:Basic 7s globulin 2 n=1 Tax=Phtheirospermum japonicum TaxID=374723 RepID=A0A830BGU5_9LAMI|nr:basic 7s globulin 2 [Phtheirospermum japonicum]
MKILINPINLFILSLIFLSHEASSQAQTTLVAPLNKDTKTSLYTITLNSNERHVIDLSAPFSWHHCPSHRPTTVECFSTECIQATYLPMPSCSPSHTTTKLPSSPCTCMVTPINPITKSCASSQLTSTNLTISRANPTAKINFTNIYLSCAPSSLFGSLPKSVSGLASLSLAPLSLPSQFATSFPGVIISRKFAICLPSENSVNGVVFFGDGPYDLRATKMIDVLTLLSYTPLLRNPKSADYFIGIKALSINRNYSISMSPYEGIKLSAVVPYTTLRTDIFEKFLDFFTKAVNGIPVSKKIKPFSACYKASAIGYSRFGLNVPNIDLEFDNGEKWTIHGANSMKRVGGDLACFAFLDGGESPEHSIVIGSFQMEDNLLVFDLDQSTLGFSSSLYPQGVTCGDFKVTSK